MWYDESINLSAFSVGDNKIAPSTHVAFLQQIRLQTLDIMDAQLNIWLNNWTPKLPLNILANIYGTEGIEGGPQFPQLCREARVFLYGRWQKFTQEWYVMRRHRTTKTGGMCCFVITIVMCNYNCNNILQIVITIKTYFVIKNNRM